MDSQFGRSPAINIGEYKLEYFRANIEHNTQDEEMEQQMNQKEFNEMKHQRTQ